MSETTTPESAAVYVREKDHNGWLCKCSAFGHMWYTLASAHAFKDAEEAMEFLRAENIQFPALIVPVGLAEEIKAYTDSVLAEYSIALFIPECDHAHCA